MGCGREEDSNRALLQSCPCIPYGASHTQLGKPMAIRLLLTAPLRIFISPHLHGPDPVSKNCSTELEEEQGSIPKYNSHPGE